VDGRAAAPPRREPTRIAENNDVFDFDYRPTCRPRSPAVAAAPSPTRSPWTGRSPEFAGRYADQNERDYAALAEAAGSGRVKAETDLG
jgi:hypothetical protein